MKGICYCPNPWTGDTCSIEVSSITALVMKYLIIICIGCFIVAFLFIVFWAWMIHLCSKSSFQSTDIILREQDIWEKDIKQG